MIQTHFDYILFLSQRNPPEDGQLELPKRVGDRNTTKTLR
jgi:hypothetical protein